MDDLFNCEDLLMNFVSARAAGTVLWVRLRRRLDISRLTAVGISRSPTHAPRRERCLAEFARMFGHVLPPDAPTPSRPPCLPLLGCVYL